MNYSELKRLAERIREGSGLQGMNAEEAMFNFECAATPAAVLALIAENEDARRTGAFWKDEKICADAVIDQLKAENEALRKVANELRRFATCEHMHHDKPEWHEYDEPCKVLARIDVVLSHGDK